MYFNPRLREGGDVLLMQEEHITKQFQSTPPRRRRPYIQCLQQRRNALFQSTPPRRRRPEKRVTLTNTLNDFNPRLREGGDALPTGFTAVANISIHASEKEATRGCSHLQECVDISIHASEKEATATYCDTSTIMYISSLNNFFVRYF